MRLSARNLVAATPDSHSAGPHVDAGVPALPVSLLRRLAKLQQCRMLHLRQGLKACMHPVQVSYACLAGVGVIILLIPANRWLAIKIQRANDRMMVFKDARVKRVGDLLHGIRHIKTAAWEHAFAQRVRRHVSLWRRHVHLIDLNRS